MVVCNLLRKAPSSYSIGLKLLNELKKKIPEFDPKWTLDFGAGLGPFTWSVNEIYPNCKNLICVEPNKNMRKLGKFIFNKSSYMESLAHTV